MILDLRRLQQRLESQPPGSVYLLMGEERFLLNESERLLKAKCVDESTRDFNSDVFTAGDVTVAQVKDAAEMLPMMSARRCVVLREVDRLKDADWDVLLPLIDEPIETTTLILSCESLDKRKKAYKRLVDKAVVVDLKRPYDQLLDWIDYLVMRHGVSIHREAAMLLRQFVGANLSELNNEIMKLRDYIGSDRTRIEAADVLQVVSEARVDRIFDLTDAIGKQDRVHALHSLANLLDHGQNEVGALSMITRHFRVLSALKEGQRAGLSGQKLAVKAGIAPFLLNNYLDQLRAWDETKIRRTFGLLLETDRALKSSNVPGHVWLENFILKSCEH
jgi:DNA polymerase III subunit delta